MQGRLGNRIRWVGAVAVAIGVPVSLGAFAAPASAAPGLNTGFMFRPEDAQARLLGQAAADRATLVILRISWADTAPSRPQNPRDPTDPAYRFADIDRAISTVRAQGLTPVLRFRFAPQWAEGRNRPSSARAGSWKPSPGAVGDFAHALARRYSGRFPAGSSQPLPRVRHFEVWNEPNQNVFLSPQWQGGKLVAANRFRRMLNAAHRAVHAVRNNNIVIAGGASPYGDPRGGARTRPLRFWREVFCLRGRRKLRPKRCVGRSQRARMDVMGHHPINYSNAPRQGRPRQRTRHPDDAASADMGKIRRVIRAAERHKRVRPVGRRPIWATEIWWFSKPPRPWGFSLRRHARFLAEAMYLAWKGGARAVVNMNLRDREFRGQWFAEHAAGTYHVDGTPKPAARAFRFPLVGDRVSKRRVRLWGLAPRGGRVVIQRKRGKRWRRVKALRAGGNRVFTGGIRLRGKATLRARAAGETSFPWRQR